jgi:hypothetical protein
VTATRPSKFPNFTLWGRAAGTSEQQRPTPQPSADGEPTFMGCVADGVDLAAAFTAALAGGVLAAGGQFLEREGNRAVAEGNRLVQRFFAAQARGRFVNGGPLMRGLTLWSSPDFVDT